MSNVSIMETRNVFGPPLPDVRLRERRSEGKGVGNSVSQWGFAREVMSMRVEGRNAAS